MTLDNQAIRSQFPALSRTKNGRPVVWADGPGGTQVPRSVIEAMTGVLERGVSNHGGHFDASVESDTLHEDARSAMADLIGADSDEIVFGQNMTSLTFAMSRALARTWRPEDEIIVTQLDHDANVTPWVLAARDAGAIVRRAEINTRDVTLDYDSMASLINPRTKLVAVTAASNATGSMVDIPSVSAMAHEVGAVVYVDAVHATPHGPIDVAALGADFLACSTYKFYGPHTGILYGRNQHLSSLDAYKVRPAPSDPPGKWETGTQSFESLAGVTAAVDYLAALGPHGLDRRERLRHALAGTKEYDRKLSRQFIDRVADIPQITVWGIKEGDLSNRTSTFAISVEGFHPDQVAAHLGEQGIFVWSGHYYAIEPMQALGLLDTGGLVRIGFLHYNSAEEVDRVVDALVTLIRR